MKENDGIPSKHSTKVKWKSSRVIKPVTSRNNTNPRPNRELDNDLLGSRGRWSRHNLLLKEFFEKNPATFQQAIELFEHRLTLQEEVGNIYSSRSPKSKTNWSSDRSSQWEYHRSDWGQRSDRASTQRSPTQGKHEDKPLPTSDRTLASRMSPPK